MGIKRPRPKLCTRTVLLSLCPSSRDMGVSERRGALFGDLFKGILFDLGYKRGTPILGNIPICEDKPDKHGGTAFTLR